MELATYVEQLRNDLAAAAEAASAEVREAADRLSYAIEPSMRMALLEALGDATADITGKLDSAVVEVRLRGRDPELVVTEHPAGSFAAPAAPEAPTPPAPPAPPTPPDVDEGMSRVSLRLPDSLKARIEQAAATAGQSVNTWLIRAATDMLDGPAGRDRSAEASGAGSLHIQVGQRITGWQR